jgi:serine/threonine protein kinase
MSNHPIIERPGRERIIRGRYRVLRVVGEGASARTLACEDLTNHRLVAVKELRAGKLDSWQHLEMFEREAKALAGLKHPGIPEIYDFFEEPGEDGLTLHLAQELIEGPSLQARIGQAPFLGGDDVVELALGILDILEYLHGRAPPLYHRDIKPSNIVLRSDFAPVLVDFGGVCHGWRAEQSGGSTVTGTFGYMPPEQLMGRVSAQSDLYALGATLLYVVTGNEPTEFDFDSGRLTVPKDLELSPALRRAIDAMLSPAPRDRPSSARQVRTILDSEQTPHASQTSALRVVERSPLPVMLGGDAPHWIDLGPPPRDPCGSYADVYGNLVEPFDDTRGASHVGRALNYASWALVAILTVGILPLAYAAHVRKRRRRYDDIFRRGVQTDGIIVSMDGSEVFVMIGYEYEVGGQTFRGFIDYPVKLKRYWTVGDRVAVLHDESDPRLSCVVFRRRQ